MPNTKKSKILHKNFIDIFNWSLSHGEFSQWVMDNDILVSAVHDGSDGWIFVNDEDLLAFKLTFKPKLRVSEIDAGYFYAPYIPLLKCPSPPSGSTI